MDYKFIVTQNEEVKDALLKEGLVLLNNSDGVYIFLNSARLTFSEAFKKKLVFTNNYFFQKGTG